MGMDFSTVLPPPEEKSKERDVGWFATNNIKSPPLESKSRKSSESQSVEDPQKKEKCIFKEREKQPSANVETRITGSVAGKVFSGYFSAGSNCFFVFLVFASNLLCQVQLHSRAAFPVNKIITRFASLALMCG